MIDLGRLQRTSRKFHELSSIVDQLTLTDARIGGGSNVRIAKVVTSGTHPSSGQTFEIEFDNGLYSKAAGGSPSYVPRTATTKWCCNVNDYLPSVGDFILVWYINGQWWTKCGQSDSSIGKSDDVYGAFPNSFDFPTSGGDAAAVFIDNTGAIVGEALPGNALVGTDDGSNAVPALPVGDYQMVLEWRTAIDLSPSLSDAQRNGATMYQMLRHANDARILLDPFTVSWSSDRLFKLSVVALDGSGNLTSHTPGFFDFSWGATVDILIPAGRTSPSTTYLEYNVQPLLDYFDVARQANPDYLAAESLEGSPGPDKIASQQVEASNFRLFMYPDFTSPNNTSFSWTHIQHLNFVYGDDPGSTIEGVVWPSLGANDWASIVASDFGFSSVP